jgi:phage FluMu protein Com
MRRNLKMKCPSCGHWNRVPVDKLFVEQPSPEPKVEVMIPMYKPLQVSKCKKCGQIIAKPRELIRITKR